MDLRSPDVATPWQSETSDQRYSGSSKLVRSGLLHLLQASGKHHQLRQPQLDMTPQRFESASHPERRLLSQFSRRALHRVPPACFDWTAGRPGRWEPAQRLPATLQLARQVAQAARHILCMLHLGRMGSDIAHRMCSSWLLPLSQALCLECHRLGLLF